MLKLINDKVQDSDAPALLKSPSLADYYETSDVTITFTQSCTVDCVGIGNTDGVNFTLLINGTDTETVTFTENGLYPLSKTYTFVNAVEVSHDGTYIGRLGLGKSRFLGCSKSREPGFYSTYSDRITASGQVIPGAGGMSGRLISVDIRGGIDRDIYQDYIDAYPVQCSRNFPFFLYFNKETERMPYERLYATTDDMDELVFQSSTNSFKYSYNFTYKERF